MALDIVAKIVAARGGDLIAEVRGGLASTVEQAAEMFGLASTPGTYFQVKAVEAKAILTEVLSFDMAYHCELMPRDEAERLAKSFVDSFEEDGASYYTNGEFGQPRKHPNVGPNWTPATTATFDTGVVVLAPTRTACAWFMDED